MEFLLVRRPRRETPQGLKPAKGVLLGTLIGLCLWIATIWIVLAMLTAPALADARKDNFLAMSSNDQMMYLVGYVDAYGDAHTVLRVTGAAAGTLGCNGLLNTEVAQLMMMSVRRSGSESLSLAMTKAFNRACPYSSKR